MAESSDRIAAPAAPPPSPPPPRPRRRRLRRWLARGLLAVLVLVLALAGAAVWVVRTDPGRAWLTATVLELVNGIDGITVRLGALEGDLPVSVRLVDLTVADAEGVWLSADSIGLAWDPLALLSRRLHITAVTASALAVDRPPVLPSAGGAPADPDTGGGLDPRLLGALRIDRVALEGTHLGAGLVGQSVLLDVTGGVDSAGDAGAPTAVTARLEARRIDGRPGRVALEGRLHGPALDRVAVTLEAGEEQGGLLSALAGLPGAAGWTMTLDGDGPLSDWTGRLEASAEGLASVAGAVGLGLADPEAPSLTLDLAATPGAGAPAMWQAVLGERLTLAARAEGPLAAPTVTAEATLREGGTAAFGAASLTLTASATPDGPLDGPTPVVALDLSARVAGLRGPPAVTGLLSRPLDLTAAATYALADGRAEIGRLRLADDRGLMLTADGTVTTAPALDATAAARLEVADLGRLAPVLGGLSPTGGGVLTLSGVTVTADAPVTGMVRLALSDAALGVAPADAVLGAAPDLSGRVTYDPADGLRVADLALQGAHAGLTGTLAIDAAFAHLDADATVTLDDLGRVTDGAAGGAVTVDAALSGPLADPAVTATARLPAATLAGMAWDDVTLEAAAAGLASGATGSARLNGTGPGGRLDLETAFALPGYARVRVSDLVLTVPGARLSGGTETDFATLLTTGDLALAVSEPGALAGWGLPPLSGSLDARVALAAPEGRQRVEVTARAPALGLADADGALGAVDLEATLTDALDTPRLDARVQARDGTAGGVTWDRLTATAAGPLADLAVTAELAGAGPTGTLALETAARVQPPGLAATARVVLERLALDSAGHRVALRGPATVALDGPARVDRLALALDDGTLTVEGGLAPDGGLDLAVTGADLPLGLADLAVPDLGLGGRLDLSASLRGRLPTPRGTLSLTAREVALARAEAAPPLAADVSGTLRDGRLGAEATVRGFADTPARLSADLPLRLGGGAAMPETAPLSARVDWEGPVARVWEMLPLVEHRLAGDLTLHAAVSGSLAAPAVDAEVRLAGGRYEHLTLGTLLDDLSLSATAAGSDRVTVSLTGGDGGAGRLSAEGDVRLAGDGPTGRVTATLDDMVLLRRDDVTARADADLAFDLEGTGAALTGTVETEEVRVRLIGGGGGSVQTLEVVEIDDAGRSALAALEDASAAEATAEEETGAGVSGGPADTGFPVRLDIAVRMPNRVYVSGQGLESEWAGDLSVGGTAAAPRITGTIAVRRGTLDAVGKTFTVETGEVRFAGGTPVNPLLEVIAVYETTGLEARVGLRGPARDPALVLESQPPLPRDEVISRILFGKRSGALTTVETVQVARVLASLSGATDGDGLNVVDSLRRATGLDVLSVGGEGLEAGTYLGDDIYVGVEQGIEAGSGGVTVEVDLGAGFKVESKAARSGQGEVGVMWEMDY
ncbi:translocation/assembly module TamB domain-containing protein [Roseospira goensis]|uniref:Translocation and assembly module TamB n=1 Tax=Roseospira goensis TaxID=391922 RepID=A0A7W6S042_9PROT|nr:translocation/assembly module TamB domain-containing protein [Roseospira goensis]MBB4285819.1 translocation and assembly module TamB [Roseospira goensis]